MPFASKGFSSKCRPPHFPQSGGFGGSTSETTGEPFTLPQSRQTHPIGVFGLNAISIPILHKRIKRPPPIAGGMKLHHLQNFRQQSGKDVARIPQLTAVGRTAVSRAAVDNLVSQGIEAVEQHQQYRIRILRRQSRMRLLLRPIEIVAP